MRRRVWILAVLIVLILAGWAEHRTGLLRFFAHLAISEVKWQLSLTQFDAGKWKAYGSGKWPQDDYIRQRMVDDLLATHRLVGMTKGQVNSLLGKPDNDLGNEFSYTLGPERGLISIDFEALDIRFDRHGIATKAEVVSH